MMEGAISNELRSLSVTLQAPSTLLEYINLLSGLDAGMRAAHSMARYAPRTPNSQYWFGNDSPRNSSANPTNQADGTPVRSPFSPVLKPPSADAMDLSSTRRGPPSNEEREARLRGGLCLCCGKGGHISRTCSNNRTGTLTGFSFATFGVPSEAPTPTEGQGNA